MKTFAAFLFSFAFFSLQLTATSSIAPILPDGDLAIAEFSRWEKLGSRKVNYRLDRDEIFVTGREGVFSKLQLRVKKGGINMKRMVVHFRDGSKQEVALRQTMAPGSASRIIDLKGNRRVIKKVVFWYDTKNFAGQRATLELWGRH